MKSSTPGGDMQVMKSWVVARLLWDPQADDRALITHFIKGYYGAAAPAVQQYLDLWHNMVTNSSFNMEIFVSPESSYLTPTALIDTVKMVSSAVQSVS
eukprot:gene4279-779_t